MFKWYVRKEKWCGGNMCCQILFNLITAWCFQQKIVLHNSIGLFFIVKKGNGRKACKQLTNEFVRFVVTTYVTLIEFKRNMCILVLEREKRPFG